MAPTNKLTQLIQPLFDHKAFSYIKTYITLSLVLICIGIGSAQSLSELDTTALKQMLVDAESEIDKIPILKRLVAKNAGVNNAAIAKYLEALKIIANQEKRYDVLGYVADKNATFAYFGGDLDQARSKFKESYDVYLKTDSFDLAYISKIKIGVMHSIQGNYNNAELIYREVDEEISSETHLKAAAFLHNNLGTLFHYQGIADSAHHYYNKAIQDYLELEDSINVLRPMQNQSLLWRGDKKAVHRLIEIADIRRALGNKADLMVTLNALSNVQVVNNNNYERSQKYAEEAYHLSKDVEGVHFKIKALVQLCSVSLFQEDYEQALKYIDEAKDLSLKSDLKEEIISVYLNYGRIYWNQKKYNKAKEYYLEAVKSLGNEENYLGTNVYLELSEVYYALKQKDEASSFLDKAIKFSKEIDSEYILKECYVQKARVYADEGKWKNTLKYLKLTDAFDQAINYFSQLEILELKAKAYKKLGKHQFAYETLSQFITMKDSIDEINNIRELTKNKKDFEFAQEKEILALEQEKKEAVLKAESKQFQIAAIGIGALALLALGFFFNSSRKNKIIEKANDQLSALNNTKDQIFSIIGHDLKKPAIAFRGITEKLRYLIDSGDKERLIKYGESVEKDALELNKLTDNLLSWALLQKDLITFKEEKINLAKLSSEVVNLFSNVAKEKKITLSTDIQNVFVNSDKSALATVLRNLVDNALKYTGENGHVIVSAQQTGSQVELLVKDDGQGILQEKLPNLFALAQEKSTQGTSGEKGTGLGLHIVKDLVEKCKGTINVESILGEGTTFSIALPV